MRKLRPKEWRCLPQVTLMADEQFHSWHTLVSSAEDSLRQGRKTGGCLGGLGAYEDVLKNPGPSCQ